MKQNINEIKRMQQLAGIITEAQLNEDPQEVEALPGFEWLSKTQIPTDGTMSALGNTKNHFDIKSYKDKIMQDIDRRDWGFALGDSVFSLLRDTIESRIHNLPDAFYRDFLENPTTETADGNNKLLKQTLGWKKWTESIPDSSEGKYLINNPDFNKYILNPLHGIFDELTHKGSTKDKASLVWAILPYLASYWYNEVVVALNMPLMKNIK